MGAAMKQKTSPLPVRLAAIACSLSMFLLPISPALAKLSNAERARAEAKAMEAKIEFKSGNHGKAAQLFLEAFAISRAPALMYNAARAYQTGNMPGKAIIVFEQYLDLEDVTDAGRAEAKGHLEQLRKQVAAGADKPAPTVKPDPAPTPTPQPKVTPTPAAKVTPTPPDKSTAKPIGPVADVVTPAPQDDRGKWVTWGLLGGGGLLFLVGAGTMSSAAGDLQEANDMDFGADGAAATYKQKADEAESKHGSGILVTLVGLGLGGWGAWRMWLAPRFAAPSAATTTWFAQPQLGPTWDGQAQYGLTVGGHFR